MVSDSPTLALCAEVAELADAQASGACGRKVVKVQILSSAPAFASVFAPFSFSGSVVPPGFAGGPFPRLVGRGTVRVDLAWVRPPDGEGDGWDFQHALYEFQTPAAVPEPGTFVLVGSGIAGYLIRRRRRASVR
jgi:PEP-CTERM motif